MKEITHGNFTNEVLTTNNVVLLDIWAPWCAPCIGMVPIVDKLAEELSGKITVAKLDAEASPELIAELGITSLPTFLVFKDGKIVANHVGSATKEQLLNLVAIAQDLS